MSTIDLAAGSIHLPERWVVLEQALAQMEQENAPEPDLPEGEGSVDDRGEEPIEPDRTRDAEDTRSRTQPVRPSADAATTSDGPRAGVR